MFSHTTTVDQSGRIILPQPALEALGVRALRKIKTLGQLAWRGFVAVRPPERKPAWHP